MTYPMTTVMKHLLVPALLLLLPAGCGPSYSMKEPSSFKRYHESDEYKLITADGMLLKVREVENYPRGGLKYWVDAMRLHLTEQGYVVRSEECFETERKLEGCTLSFLAPLGAEDWVLNETLFVVDDTIYLLEAAGPAKRFSSVDEELKAAVKTFDPEGR